MTRSLPDITADRLVRIAPATSLGMTLTYRVPSALVDKVSFGTRVLIPLKRKIVTGFVIGEDHPFVGEVRDIIDVLDSEPLFDEETFRFYRFMADYYCAPLGEVIKRALPRGFTIETRRTVRAVDGCVGESDIERDILELASHPKGITVGALIRRLKKEAVRYHLDRLARAGAVVFEEIMDTHGAKRGSVKIVRMAGIEPPEGFGAQLARSPKAREILDYIRREGEVAYPVLKERWGDLGGPIRRLVRIGAVEVTTEYRERAIELPDMESMIPEQLSPAQERALAGITGSIRKKEFSVWLLFGVTGSGKTEVYIRAAQEALAMGRDALVLVPEISLTPQLLARFVHRLGNTVALFHSGLSEGERLDQWWRVKAKKARVVLGARSALFLPVSEPGVIIVDEEHDPSYKQGETPRYHARDAAVMLGRLKNAAVVLGSATPSLESMENARRGRYSLVTLPERVTKMGKLPRVEIVDLKGAEFATRSVSKRLADELRRTVADGRQAIVLLNRRGFSSFILCPVCGYNFPCPSCSITLTYHKNPAGLLCHYCGFHAPAPDTCTKCGSYNLLLMGTGIQRVEEEISSIVPGARISRLDRDIARRKGEVQKILSAFSRKEADILLGTQMVAKGHDFPDVTLVGVINADIALNLPDFRSSERTFTLLTQAAGRAGRGDTVSTVLIQTYNPEHYAIQAAADHDYTAFAEKERQIRAELSYPPFSRIVLVRLVGTDQDAVCGESIRIRDECRRAISDRGLDVEILGPVPSPIARIMDRYRYQILMKGQERRSLFELLGEIGLDGGMKERRGVMISVDIDPTDML